MSTDTQADWGQQPGGGSAKTSLLTAILGSIVIVFVMAFVYGSLEKWSPLVYLNLILALGLGWGIGWAVCKMLYKYHVHGRSLSYLVWLIASLAGI